MESAVEPVLRHSHRDTLTGCRKRRRRVSSPSSASGPGESSSPSLDRETRVGTRVATLAPSRRGPKTLVGRAADTGVSGGWCLSLMVQGRPSAVPSPDTGPQLTNKKVLIMTDVACFCGCCYSFEGGVGSCPRCGAWATVWSGPSTTAGNGEPPHPVSPPTGATPDRQVASSSESGRELQLVPAARSDYESAAGK